MLAPAPTGAVLDAIDGSGVSPEPAVIVDFPLASASTGARPNPALPDPVGSVAKTPPHPKLTGHRVSGSATWYCQTGVSACHNAYPGGLYAAAGPELRVGAWRGRQVRVCSGGDCVWVRLIDWCACGGSHVIDLYSDAFRQLAPLNAGALRVTVSW